MATDPHFAVFCEMQDAAALDTDTLAAPHAATIELAKLVTEFDGAIGDERRDFLIKVGGALLRLGNALDERRNEHG